VGSTIDVGDGYQITAQPPTPSTGLTYRYDPGQDWVGLGCLILVAGFVMALFFVPVKLYAKISAFASSSSKIEIAATTTKGNAIYEDDFASLIHGLREAVSRRPVGEADRAKVEAYA
jgi:cytochrome c biogenesis protein ResB